MKKTLLTAMTLSLGLAALSSAALVHRYSFDTDATDSIGGADATLFADASVSGGALVLDGTGDYANLDAATIAINTFSEVTIEAWWTHNAQSNWQRVFDFGATDGGLGADYLFYSPVGNPGGSASQYAAISDANPGFGNEDSITVAGKLANGYHHMALTLNDATNTMTLYVDGVQIGQNTTTEINLSDLSNQHAFLGESSYTGDNNLNGSIDEFRIYDSALDAGQIAANFTAGANTVAVPEPSSSALVGLAGLALILRRRK